MSRWMVLPMTFIIFSIILTFLPLYSTVNAFWQTQNQPISGQVIVLDPGHGGWDNGAEREDVLEDEINFLIAQELYLLLTNAGAIVFFTRAGDYDLASLYAINRKREDMNRRIRFIRSTKPTFFMSIHLNVFSDSSVFGGQVFYQRNEIKSKLLADNVQQELNELSGKDKLPKVGNYFILEETDPIGVLVECGFLSNPTERNALITPEYQLQIAQALFKGVEKYLRPS